MTRLLIHAGLLFSLLAAAAHAQNDIRFGVLTLFHPRELTLEKAGTQTLAIHTGSRELILNGEPEHRRLLLGAQEDEVIVRGVAATVCTVEARDGSKVRFRLAVPGKMNRVYEGKLTITAHRGVLTAILAMDREMAVASIVASEMPLNAPLEALKAQAVVSRSFLAAGPRHHDFDFCDTTHCQFLRSPEDVNDRIRQAVADTRGLVLVWHGQTIAALYSSRCGGQTRSLADVGMNPRGSYPYYAVECHWCREHPIRWLTRMRTAGQAPPSSNESARIAYVRQWGWSALPGSSFTEKRDAGGVTVEGHSVGHSLGMCQLGAIGLASSGADFRSILAHYYPNTAMMQLPQ